MMKTAAYKKLLWPALTLLVILIPGWPWLKVHGSEAKDLSQQVVYYIFGTGMILAMAWLIVRLIEVLVWRLLEVRLGTQIPRLLKDIVAGLIFLVAGITIVGLVFQKSVTGIWATSGAVGLVVGFALRNLIADVFSGIAINVDQPFKIGQWIQLHPRSIEPMKGCVTEISWRSTRIRTTDNTLIVVPNSQISSMILTNFSEPESKTRFELNFCLDFGVPTERALRVLLAGAKAAKAPLRNPAPKVFADRVSQCGVEYKVRYWLEPSEVSPKRGRHDVTSSILKHLHHAGITLAYEKQDLYLAPMPSRQLDRRADRVALLQRVDLFSGLEPGELARLARQMKEQLIGMGEAVVKKGEAGASMYILVEGLLDVFSTTETGQKQIEIEAIHPGEFFGEMSLLTGEPRSATVVAVTDAIVYEIGKEEFSELLESRPEIAHHISQVVAQRRATLEAKGKILPEEPAPSHHTFAEQILERMKNFFGSLRGALSIGQPAVKAKEIERTI